MGVAGFKATWLINGDNMGNLYDYNATLHRMVSMGHQIGSHTYVSSPPQISPIHTRI